MHGLTCGEQCVRTVLRCVFPLLSFGRHEPCYREPGTFSAVCCIFQTCFIILQVYIFHVVFADLVDPVIDLFSGVWSRVPYGQCRVCAAVANTCLGMIHRIQQGR